MIKVTKKVLLDASKKMMIEMSEEEYDTLLQEFELITEQINIISTIEGIDEVEPMVFPYPVSTSFLREDEVIESISQDEVLKNVKDTKDGFICLSKVVNK